MIDRRTFVLGMTSLAAWPRAGICREPVQLPLSGELDGQALAQRIGAARLVRVERLGESREGRPIELLSIGRGSRHALIVGAPHANEPIGCATIVRLIERLVSEPKLRDGSGWQWHFIPAIDIDGIALNQTWFRGPLTLPRYVDGFYRPPFRLQPEYSFPLDVPGYRFDQETPESRCWRLALDHIRPQLQCSLHGADTGGSFFIVSELKSELRQEFERLPAAFDITLNTIGDSSADLGTLAPGVFSFPNQDAAIARAVAAGKDPGTVWSAGDSSAGYSKRYQTYNMTCEVPLWRDSRERDPRSSGRTLTEVLDESIRLVRADGELLTGSLETLEGKAGTEEAQALLASLKDAALQTEGAVDELNEMKAAPGAGQVLTRRDLVQYEMGTVMFRTLTMAVRLARLTRISDLEMRARAELERRMGDFQRVARLVPVPLHSSTGLQMAAILATARSLRDQESEAK